MLQYDTYSPQNNVENFKKGMNKPTPNAFEYLRHKRRSDTKVISVRHVLGRFIDICRIIFVTQKHNERNATGIQD